MTMTRFLTVDDDAGERDVRLESGDRDDAHDAFAVIGWPRVEIVLFSNGRVDDLTHGPSAGQLDAVVQLEFVGHLAPADLNGDVRGRVAPHRHAHQSRRKVLDEDHVRFSRRRLPVFCVVVDGLVVVIIGGRCRVVVADDRDPLNGCWKLIKNNNLFKLSLLRRTMIPPSCEWQHRQQ